MLDEHEKEQPEKTEIIGSVVLIQNMSPELWTRYKWLNIKTDNDHEVKYLCMGVRAIEDVERAAQEYAAFRTAWGF